MIDGERPTPGGTGGALKPSDTAYHTETSEPMVYYICGGMRGYANFNFPAFYEAEKELEKMGHIGVNPARHDRELGFDETKGEVTQAYLRKAFAWDLAQVCESDGVVVLPGWHRSRGARAEVATAKSLGLPIYCIVHEDGEPHLREAHHE